MTQKYQTGLVLSGGGTRGFAHLGVIAALEKLGIQPDVISGVSAGAIVGAFIAAGKSPEEVRDTFKSGWFFQYTKIHFPVDGLLKLDGVKEIIEKEIAVENIEDLKTPFYICVSNLNMGTVEYKSTGKLSDTVLASASIPIIFAPVELGKYLYVDGGLMDNIPVAPIRKDCERIIASNISPINPKAKMKNLIQIATRTVYMSVNQKLDEIKKQVDVYIEPRGIDEYDVFQRKHADELFDLGYKKTLEVLK
ncbi:patatin-like phospholipase family protein [Draconibacterium sp. IB214405]|uniref:patatin-like phospholipase family protein n=1 Tax=Draconibacterium sp. IB214405 TaxID=3097352 RepID=UPI002A14BEC1|nr:patatin-like phospholipase family protein [Draconibacterium sp. IB214405]MDX8338675.1 patatin-like phospholipase family protein [Draconibacterium sp. IB214405]